MNDKRREKLLGYLLGALEPQESAKIDAKLRTNTVLRDDLATLYQEISPINEIVDDHEPPFGLATRTCENLWEKVDTEQNSAITNAFTELPNPRKKRRITVIQSYDDKPKDEVAFQRPHFSCQSELEPESQDLSTDAVIPLSRALLFGTPGKLRKPNEILRRVDQADNNPRQSHLFYADSVEIVRNSPPKYYGREKKEEKTATPWSTRDVFASLFVGLTAAILIFPLVQIGLGNFRDMIIQKKLENVAKSMSPNTSQYSQYGFSQNDLRVLAGMNIDPQSPLTLQSQQNNAVSSFTGLQETVPSSSPASMVFPVGLSGRNSEVGNWP